ncbi:hypothetical protein DSM26151_24430 [Agromyces marinus]|uniref:Uncharacterized protein n=1 Tax=Agromyces marinus TaxID=1389020 RepID=A0ABN6YHN3_9MICO|nr:hypothetical protein DSM26151_24430 [Agromyces marinus]BDZ55412.1 hypothetical protein GCM10025870_24850 [Agromyces marinus]
MLKTLHFGLAAGNTQKGLMQPPMSEVGPSVARNPEGGEVVQLTLRVDGEWNGWDGDTVVKLTDGSVWRQVEYRYEYRYAYRPAVSVSSGKMQVEGMSRAVRVERL